MWPSQYPRHANTLYTLSYSRRARRRLHTGEPVLLQQPDDCAAGPLAMRAVMRDRRLDVAATNRVGDRAVLEIGLLEIRPESACRHAGAMSLVPQHVRHRCEPRISAVIDQRAMEPLD